jgi:hypothetical protein
METQESFDHDSFENGHRGSEPGSLAMTLLLESNADAIITEAPKQPFRLGFFSTLCLIINCVIGTGIFSSPSTVIKETNFAGGAMLLWFAGCLYVLAGMYVYVEYGPKVPRYAMGGLEVPRSGKDLHYVSHPGPSFTPGFLLIDTQLQYVYRRVPQKGTILLSGCLFGISSICLGNTVGNSIRFAIHILEAINPSSDFEPSKELVGVLALATAALTCTIAFFSRPKGIWLTNLFACVKVGILLLILALAFKLGILDKQKGLPSAVEENLWDAFSSPKAPLGLRGCESPLDKENKNGYARAFLSISESPCKSPQ